MPIDYNDLYQQKKDIESNKFQHKETYNRLLISRGYYASFSHACALVHDKKKGIILLSNKGYGTHQIYYESLMQSNNYVLASIGKKLQVYHGLRKVADYKLKQHVKDLDVKKANQYLEECKKLINSLP